MPLAALRICTYPGCHNLTRSGRCELHQAQPDRLRDPRVVKLYNDPRWKQIRAEQLEVEPFCRICKRNGKLTRATEVDHIEPHNGDEFKFFFGPFQSLCHSCHTKKTNDERRRTRIEGGGGGKKF